MGRVPDREKCKIHVKKGATPDEVADRLSKAGIEFDVVEASSDEKDLPALWYGKSLVGGKVALLTLEERELQHICEMGHVPDREKCKLHVKKGATPDEVADRLSKAGIEFDVVEASRDEKDLPALWYGNSLIGGKAVLLGL